MLFHRISKKGFKWSGGKRLLLQQLLELIVTMLSTIPIERMLVVVTGNQEEAVFISLRYYFLLCCLPSMRIGNKEILLGTIGAGGRGVGGMATATTAGLAAQLLAVQSLASQIRQELQEL